jgi:hypothetical protein
MDREMLDAGEIAGHLVPPGSVFAFLAEHRRELFPINLRTLLRHGLTRRDGAWILARPPLASIRAGTYAQTRTPPRPQHAGRRRERQDAARRASERPPADQVFSAVLGRPRG